MSSSTSANAVENRYTFTEVRSERIVHNWTIKSVNLFTGGVDEWICSPWFFSRDKSEKWRFLFYPCGEHNNPSEGIDYVALFLARDSPGKSPIEVYTRMKISVSDKALRNLSFTHEYEPQEVFGYDKFLERSKLLNTNSSADDEFTINCVTFIPAETIPSSCDEVIFDLKKSTICDDFRLLLKDPMFSDFSIIVGDKKFATHKVILARRSSVLAAIFEHKDLEEHPKKEVKIENIEPDVIEGMLEFIYTDQVTNINELASGLLEAANKYDLAKLRNMCEKALYEGLSKENAAKVLLLADLHHADTLKKCVMKYIVDHAPELVKSNNWKETGWNLELLLELFDQLALSQAANYEKSQSSTT